MNYYIPLLGHSGRLCRELPYGKENNGNGKEKEA